MTVQSTHLRRWTIGMQLLAGVSLLTASYFTTEQGWANEVLKAAVHSDLSTTKTALENMRDGISC